MIIKRVEESCFFFALTFSLHIHDVARSTHAMRYSLNGHRFHEVNETIKLFMPRPIVTVGYLKMSRSRRCESSRAACASTALVMALLELAKIDEFCGIWRSVDDVARIINAVFDLPRSSLPTISRPEALNTYCVLLFFFHFLL
jgi:hypothetical protein